jgi:hypothetical protein
MVSKNIQPNATRTAVSLSTRLDRSLIAYIAAAGAAGVGLIAAVQPAEAEIVYTKTNLNLSLRLPLDLNGDGVTDLYFSYGGGSNEVILQLTPAVGNGVVGLRSGPRKKRNCCSSYPAPMFFGLPVGPGENFRFQPSQRMATFDVSASTSSGQWLHKTNRYLGVKFLISGHTHYGWIRVSTIPFFTITGYAYETIPNKSIKTGDVGGPAVDHEASVVSPTERRASMTPVATLGVLARGADALAVWRRDEEAIANTM